MSDYSHIKRYDPDAHAKILALHSLRMWSVLSRLRTGQHVLPEDLAQAIRAEGRRPQEPIVVKYQLDLLDNKAKPPRGRRHAETVDRDEMIMMLYDDWQRRYDKIRAKLKPSAAQLRQIKVNKRAKHIERKLSRARRAARYAAAFINDAEHWFGPQSIAPESVSDIACRARKRAKATGNYDPNWRENLGPLG